MPESSESERRTKFPAAGAGGRGEGITICILSRNNRAFLPRLLTSALEAARRLEAEGIGAGVLVIDDASRDGSQRLLRSVQALYDNPFLEVVCLEASIGVSGMRNLALEMAGSRYICTMREGDELAPEGLPTILRSMRDTGAALAYGNLIEMDGGEVVGMRSNTTISPGQSKPGYADGICVADAERLLRLEGYTSLQSNVPEDWEMMLHLHALEELVLFIPVVAGYRHGQLEGQGREPGVSEGEAAALKKIYAPEGTRAWENIRIGRIYHPATGFVDGW